jgi:iron complex outermembrane receptor protein
MKSSVRAVFASLLVSLAFGARAQMPSPPDRPDSEARELEDLVAILSEETAVATKTRMNSDFVPGVVTVLHGDELEALGVETAWEALSFVPGILAVRDRVGLPSVLVRVCRSVQLRQPRVLVNGAALARELAGINGTSLYIPIQLVERIEVIRGPGSVVYGDFAFMGLVTSSRGRQARARGADHVSLARLAHAGQRAGMSIAVSGSAASNDAPRPRGDRRAALGGWTSATRASR